MTTREDAIAATTTTPFVSPDITSRHATAPPWSLFALRSHDVRNARPASRQAPNSITTTKLTLTSPLLVWPSTFPSLRRILAGPLACSPLPPIAFTMSLRRKAAAASSNDTPPPRVAGPSDDVEEEYTGPRTRSGARRRNVPPTPSQTTAAATTTQDSSSSEAESTPGKRKSRTRSRSPVDISKLSRMTPRIAEPTPTSPPNGKAAATTTGPAAVNGGFLAPPLPGGGGFGWSWRDLSRSPSPLGLIPIHRHFKTFVHKHEVPRKALHVSIGFFVVWLYTTGTQTSAVAPYLMAALVPVAATDLLRHRFAPVNRLYVRALGALMRESEYAGYNGVIWYLLGAWTVLWALPKDVAVMSVLLLSWCDTAASTFGRLWGRYTPRLRRGKSLAGSAAAFAVGVATSVFFYGWLVPTIGPKPGDDGFLFRNVLALPAALVGEDRSAWSVTGSLALGVMSVVAGVVASASEVVDIFGWDDNLTIPVLSGLGMYGFLKVFG
ncbi:Phosphatidate cytidylyltransferase [Cordyceps militaris]|uniref:Phosphatidate cytidylyltransferase n=1 Tax=Cordyceps militaris TaxID=73501 RepID=A0A2H4SS18_CORMI|nr:Phosphatidate cytidylyltransferase [Cordyceps militaris]